MKKIITIITTITLIVITLITVAKATSFIITNAPETSEELVTVVATYDNIVEVEREDGNIYSCYGTTDATVLVAEFSNDELIDLHSVNNYTIGEIKSMCGSTYYIVKDSNLAILNPADYEDSQCISAGIIDDIDEFGYCFFV